MRLRVAPGPHGIAAARLVRRRSPLSRLDGWPWLILHAAAYATATSPAVERVLESYALPILLSASFAAHALCVLGQFWSVSWFFLTRFEAAAGLADADSVFVEPLPHAGNPEIVPLLRRAASNEAPLTDAKAGVPQPPLSEAWLGVAQLGFSYQSSFYDISPEGGSGGAGGGELAVSRLVLPDACPLRAYQAWSGWRSREVDAAIAKWGANAIVMPSPTFAELSESNGPVNGSSEVPVARSRPPPSPCSISGRGRPRSVLCLSGEAVPRAPSRPCSVPATGSSSPNRSRADCVRPPLGPRRLLVLQPLHPLYALLARGRHGDVADEATRGPPSSESSSGRGENARCCELAAVIALLRCPQPAWEG